ncbi:MAG TPA: tetratricopeptide repeat protein [Candidatus Dormibacteraeota bacterium]|nr:tetratricopeptide repeat protein [Candidatus Dormibacteraeota bacterium]
MKPNRVATTVSVALLVFLLAFIALPARTHHDANRWPGLRGHDSAMKQSAVAPSKNVGPSKNASGSLPLSDEQEKQADLFMARKEYSEAAGVYQKLVEQAPTNAVYLNKLGIAYHQQSMLKTAQHFYEKSVKTDPHYADALNNIGTVFYQRKKFRKAVQYYKKALRIREDLPSVYSNLGYAYFSDKHYPEAMEAFQRALQLDPTVFEHSSRSGSILQDRSVNDHGTFYFLLAKSYAQMGNTERCMHYLLKARDEGYTAMAAVKSDPAFSAMLREPGMKEIIEPPAGADEKKP